MLRQFAIDEQQFERVGTVTRETSNGRTVRLGVWQSWCADCGTPFRQERRDWW